MLRHSSEVSHGPDDYSISGNDEEDMKREMMLEHEIVDEEDLTGTETSMQGTSILPTVDANGDGTTSVVQQSNPGTSTVVANQVASTTSPTTTTSKHQIDVTFQDIYSEF